MTLLFSTLLPLLFITLYSLRKAEGHTDDAKEYLKLGRGEVAEGPFERRWLAPFLNKDDISLWRSMNNGCTVAICILLGLHWGWQAVVLYMGLSSLSRIPLVIPCLVDTPSFLFALLATLAPFPANVFLAIVSGAFKETGPVFAAAWSLNPLLLLGLVGVNWFHKKTPSDKPFLSPFWKLPAIAIPSHGWLSWHQMLFPWGALAILVPVGLALGADPVAPLLSLALGYGSLILARDRARLYEWAFPALLPAAMLCPPWLIYPLLLPHLMNPSPEV